jgi:hypothetical protein
MPTSKPPEGRVRQIAAGMVALLLFIPASAMVPTAQWNVHLVQRLLAMRRISPDAGLDLYFRRLVPFLPAKGDVGFRHLGPPDEDRTFFRMQYALAPRQLLRSAEAEFVVEFGPLDAEGSLGRDTRFVLVTSPGEDLRLYRRLGR